MWRVAFYVLPPDGIYNVLDSSGNASGIVHC